jgi:steroid delta-isomerase-like uncharacterized protein
MTKNEVQQVVRKYGKALGGKDIDAMLKFHADKIESDSMTMLAREKPMSSPEEMREWLELFQRGFPDKSFTVENIVVDGGNAVFQWRIRGTNTGPFRGMAPPTNKAIDIRGCSLLVIKNGKIVRETSYWDSALLLRQVGLLPEFELKPGVQPGAGGGGPKSRS